MITIDKKWLDFVGMLSIEEYPDDMNYENWLRLFLDSGDARVIQHQREIELNIEPTVSGDEWLEFQRKRQEVAEEL